jgi:hypothetical protein
MDDDLLGDGLPHDSRAQRLVRDLLPEALSSLGRPPAPACFVGELLALLTRRLRLLEHLALRIAHGGEITAYMQDEIGRLMALNELEDLEPIDALNERHAALKCAAPRRRPRDPVDRGHRHLAALVAGATRDMAQAWDGSSFQRPAGLAEPMAAAPPRPPGLFDVSIRHARPAAPSGRAFEPADEELPAEDHSDDETDDVVAQLLESVQARGKGQHTCPYRLKCDKSGVDENGAPVVFELNSAFRSHLFKHIRPLKCGVPGCRNKKGFTRQGNLDRHMETVHSRRN